MLFFLLILDLIISKSLISFKRSLEKITEYTKDDLKSYLDKIKEFPSKKKLFRRFLKPNKLGEGSSLIYKSSADVKNSSEQKINLNSYVLKFKSQNFNKNIDYIVPNGPSKINIYLKFTPKDIEKNKNNILNIDNGKIKLEVENGVILNYFLNIINDVDNLSNYYNRDEKLEGKIIILTVNFTKKIVDDAIDKKINEELLEDKLFYDYFRVKYLKKDSKIVNKKNDKKYKNHIKKNKEDDKITDEDNLKQIINMKSKFKNLAGLFNKTFR